MEFTPKLGVRYVDKNLRFAEDCSKKRIELCETIMLAIDSPMSPPSS